MLHRVALSHVCCLHAFVEKNQNRDNRGNGERAKEYRNKHCMGNVTESSFAEIWNGRKYQEKRKILELVKPSSMDYAPCGECTRYFQHNLILSKVYEDFKDDFDKLKDITKDIEVKEAVCF